MSGAHHSTRARAALAEMPAIDPAISALALWCTHRDGPGQTRTRGDEIIYGPGFEALPLPEQTGLLAHHILHVALRHSARAAAMAERIGPAFDPMLYNLASDAIVNEVLLQGGHALPRPAIRAADLLARVIGPAVPADLLQHWDTDRLYLMLSGAVSDAPGDATERARAYARETGLAADFEHGGGSDTPPEIWSARLDQAFDAGRAAGSGIGSVLHRFADLPQARIPWEIHLRRLLARALCQAPQNSMQRPARRWIAMEAEARRAGNPTPAFQPGRSRDAGRPRLAIGLDTSSSITEAQLALFAAEALSISLRSGAETHVLGFDTKVHTRALLDRGETLRTIPFRRNGGTDFADILDQARQLDPSLIVMLTDLDGPTDRTPGCPVIWAVPRSPTRPAPFGTVLVMDR